MGGGRGDDILPAPASGRTKSTTRTLSSWARRCIIRRPVWQSRTCRFPSVSPTARCAPSGLQAIDRIPAAFSDIILILEIGFTDDDETTWPVVVIVVAVASVVAAAAGVVLVRVLVLVLVVAGSSPPPAAMRFRCDTTTVRKGFRVGQGSRTISHSRTLPSCDAVASMVPLSGGGTTAGSGPAA